MDGYENHNRRASVEEVGLGSWLNQQAQQGNLKGVKKVIGLAETKGASNNPDYKFVLDGDQRLYEFADAVIAESNKFVNSLDTGLAKVGRQANNIVIEIGKGKSQTVIDDVVKGLGEKAFFTSPGLRWLIVVRRIGTHREFVFNKKRPTKVD